MYKQFTPAARVPRQMMSFYWSDSKCFVSCLAPWLVFPRGDKSLPVPVYLINGKWREAWKSNGDGAVICRVILKCRKCQSEASWRRSRKMMVWKLSSVCLRHRNSPSYGIQTSNGSATVWDTWTRHPRRSSLSCKPIDPILFCRLSDSHC